MKTSLFVLALLFLAPAEGIHLHAPPKKKAMVSIDIAKTAYEPERVAEASKPPSEEFNMMLDEAFSFHKGSYQSLLQANEMRAPPKGIDLTNLKNMGYEGSFWFGTPAQEMQVIFDTGSAWAWLFSEECKQGNCPPGNKKYQ